MPFDPFDPRFNPAYCNCGQNAFDPWVHRVSLMASSGFGSSKLETYTLLVIERFPNRAHWSNVPMDEFEEFAARNHTEWLQRIDPKP